MSDWTIGVRTYGKTAKRERWYRCAIMGEHKPMSETVIEMNPTSPYRHMRVCVDHRDERSYLDNITESPPRQTEDEDN